MLDIVLIGSIAVDDTTLTLDIFLASRATGMVSVLVALRVIADANGRTELSLMSLVVAVSPSRYLTLH